MVTASPGGGRCSENESPESSPPSRTDQLEDWLAGAGIHEEWGENYHTVENDRFYQRAFDFICPLLEANPDGALILDAGCGDAAHSVRLARRGFHGHGLDLSATALERARKRIEGTDLDAEIDLYRGSLLDIPFDDGAFDHVVCWGVLMHVAEVEKALDELVRVVRPGGSLVVSESNRWSVESVLLRVARKFKDTEATLRRTPAGVEHWRDQGEGAALYRDADMGWLERELKRRRCQPRIRHAGQLTELYTRVTSEPVNRILHALNRIWFDYVGWPGPAKGNILIADKWEAS